MKSFPSKPLYGFHGHSNHFGTVFSREYKKNWIKTWEKMDIGGIDISPSYLLGGGYDFNDWIKELISLKQNSIFVINKFGATTYIKNKKDTFLFELEKFRNKNPNCFNVVDMLYINDNFSSTDIENLVNYLSNKNIVLDSFSIQNKSQLDILIRSNIKISILQLPFNLIDNKLYESIFINNKYSNIFKVARSMLGSGLLGDRLWEYEFPKNDSLRKRFWDCKNKNTFRSRIKKREQIHYFIKEIFPNEVKRYGYGAVILAVTSSLKGIDLSVYGGRNPLEVKKNFECFDNMEIYIDSKKLKSYLPIWYNKFFE